VFLDVALLAPAVVLTAMVQLFEYKYKK
jgi:hypothetical protein